MNTPAPFGKIYLIPVGLGSHTKHEVLPISIQKVIEKTRHYVVENEKNARRFIKKIAPTVPQDDLRIETLNKFTTEIEASAFITPCLEGQDIGVLSDAGCPAVADPGALLVKIAHQKNIEIHPLVGPSSLLLALMGSGLNGQGFCFHGYLPVNKQDRKQQIKKMEFQSFKENQSQIFIETPYRNEALFEDLKNILHPDTLLCVAVDLSLTTEYIKTQSISEWQKNKVKLHKRPCVFIIHKF